MRSPLRIDPRADFSAAKTAWRRLLLLQLFASIVAAGTALFPGPRLNLLAGLIALVTPAGLYLLKKSADETYERAETIRRLKLLNDGLGDIAERGEIGRLHAELTDEPSDDPEPIGKYYNSRLPKGPRRLAQLIWESAHFTAQLARTTASHAALAAGAGVAAIVLWFYVYLSMPSLSSTTETTTWLTTAGPRAAGASAAILAVFGLGILADLWRNFRSLAETAGQVCKRCESLVERADTRLEDVVSVLGDYNAAVVRAAPIPTYIWRARQKKLSDSWTVVTRHARQAPGSAQATP